MPIGGVLVCKLGIIDINQQKVDGMFGCLFLIPHQQFDLPTSEYHQSNKSFIASWKWRVTTNPVGQSLLHPSSPERRCSYEPWRRSWPWWRATSSVPASNQWRPWGSVWAAGTRGAAWAGGARRRTGRCHRSARGWWHAAASPATGCRHRHSPLIPLKSHQRELQGLRKLEALSEKKTAGSLKFQFWNLAHPFRQTSNRKHCQLV